MRRNFFTLLLVWLAAGCGTPLLPARLAWPAGLRPTEEMVTQRAVLTVRGRQFALNGYLAQSAAGDRRLIITEMFGQVLADVLVKADGAVQVMRSSPLFRPVWIERYVAADMAGIFGGVPGADQPVQKLNENHFVIARRWYKLDLQIVDIKPGPQPPDLFDATQKAKR